ncbi:hypothetical protein SARC_10168 [Sphaeroforma arctica JP610]|uniref:Endonuclease/exonuclease/phosphatase domain-containing protein n=1 Tax=Sphaeroforma arctica JP610 TaxID=667725 RepID=A0A0L0FKS0_9EUKA|nr:hypothetical protein SARC_10168 [Sphaeroforma arctica JP610]KNC77370.1 hypothetical protein SARC_10168 [Sphaeroforma arctica JP610]|eukprot:XP_014151272.1 hypothetical protein SARC_10168 [Sphaeroforma arctica JP610]
MTKARLLPRCIVNADPDVAESPNLATGTTVLQKIKLSVMQFNVLADSLAYSAAFPLASTECLKWSHRAPLILEEIVRFSPTVVCLEEVDHFDELDAALRCEGYEGVFLKKSKGDSLDGCAVFYKTLEFKLGNRHDLLYRDELNNDDNQVALSVVLQHTRSSRKVHVVTTHLKAKDDFEDVRLEQIKVLSLFLTQECYATLPLVVCGDLNTECDGPVYAHLMQLPTLKLDSAYRQFYGKEPPHTTLKHRPPITRRRTIDYIFYSTQHFKSPSSVLRIPSEEEVGEAFLPCERYPSDHIAIMSVLVLRPQL